MKIGDTGTRSAFGPYQIRSLLGRGGIGEVYRAWDPRLEREVALKVLRDRAEIDPHRVERFVAEARAASALNHPNILTVFDAAVDGATPYIVSELIDGESLRDVIHRGPIPLKRVLDVAAQIADGLADAHDAGIVHRDLKPENIMVTRAGRAKILDFGLAQPLGLQSPGAVPTDLDGQTVTDPGLLAGTVPYMSPEQARGASTDFRSDQFSFGLILYEMTTGRAAFRRGTPAETLDAIIGEEPASISTLNPNAPLLLAWLVDRCLAKNPNDRYAVTSDLQRDLRTLRDRLGEAVARDTRAAAAASARLGTARRVLAIVSAVALSAAAVVIWRLASDLPREDTTTLRFSPFATEAAYKGFPAWSPVDSQVIAYVAEVDGVLQVFTRRRNASAPAQITDAAYDCRHPFWSPDGRSVYYVSMARDRDGIWSVPAAGGAARVVVENATRGAISPDGKILAFLRDDARADVVGTAAIWLTSADGSEQPRRYDRQPFGALRFSDAALSFTPDGTALGVVGAPGTIALQPERRGWQFWLLPLAEGEPTRRLQAWSDIAPRISSFTWMPDSRRIIIAMIPLGTTGADLWMADVETDRAWPLTRGPVNSSYPSASPSGEEVVFMSDEPHYDVIEVPLGGGPVRTLVGTSRNETDPAWSPGADAYVYVTDRGGQDEIWLRTGAGPLDERPLITQANFKDRNIMLAAPSVSPDGRHVAYQRNASHPVWPLRIWYSTLAGGTPVPLLPETHDTYQGPPSWSPDGQWLAFAEWDTRSWNLLKVRVGGAPDVVTLRTDGIANAAPHWSPRGDWISWETAGGLLIVPASDGRGEKRLGAGGWLAHTWSSDGTRIYGIRQTDDLRLALLEVDIRTGQERTLADVGPAPPVNNQVKGLSVGRDGRTVVTSLARLRGDLWLLEGIRRPEGILERLWPRRSS